MFNKKEEASNKDICYYLEKINNKKNYSMQRILNNKKY